MLSRRESAGPEPFRRVVGDLSTGDGLPSAVAGVDTIVHCATAFGRRDVAGTARLVEAARGAGTEPHLVYVSIVGVDRIPLPYYRAKVACEEVITSSGLPWTFQRATQFHDLLALVFSKQRRSPVTLALRGLRFQPIDTRDVATRLAELVAEGPSGRAPDIGGPEVLGMEELARIYQRAHGRHRPVLELPAPGRIVAAFRAGHNLTPGRAFGTLGFERFLTEQMQDGTP